MSTLTPGADPGGGPPRPPKMRPQHQSSTKLRPQNGSFRPLNNHSFSKFLPRFAQHKLLTSNYLNFSRLATLAIVLCRHVSMHQFILFSSAHISCTLYIYHEHCIMMFVHYRLIFE